MGIFDDIGSFVQNDILKPVENVGTDIANVWNSQPTWLKGTEIGAAGLGLGGLVAGGLGAGAALGAEAAGAPLDLAAVGGLPAVGSTAVGGIAPITGAAAGGLALDPSLGAGLFDSGALGFAPPGSTPFLPDPGVPTTPGGAIDPTAAKLQAPGFTPTAGAGAPSPAGAPAALPGVAGPSDLTSAASTGGVAPPAATPAAGSTNPLAALGTALNTPTAKGAEALLSLGGLGYSLYSQNQNQKKDAAAIQAIQNQTQQTQQAANAAAAPTLQQGQLLTTYLTTGTLPAPMQAQLDQAVAAAKAKLIADAGNRGLSTDPTQNSALGADLAAIDQQALTTKGNMESTLQSAGQQMIQTANSLIATGLSATQMDAQLQEYLIGLDNQMSAQTGQAISNFAAALGGGSKSVNLKLAA